MGFRRLKYNQLSRPCFFEVLVKEFFGPNSPCLDINTCISLKFFGLIEIWSSIMKNCCFSTWFGVNMIIALSMIAGRINSDVHTTYTRKAH